jgi:hypothetical protein
MGCLKEHRGLRAKTQGRRVHFLKPESLLRKIHAKGYRAVSTIGSQIDGQD